jgi:apolipoprotein D and lipocalin family protein
MEEAVVPKNLIGVLGVWLGVWIALAASVLTWTTTAHAEPANVGLAPLAPIASLDVERYLGRWYQVAAVPQPFNLDCARDTTTAYSMIDPTNIKVVNTCTTWSGGANGIVGNARVSDSVTNAQLHVSFPGIPFQSSPDGPTNYIVTYIAQDYSWALVGDPMRFSGFVLSRVPSLSDAAWREIRFTVESRGYNSCLLLTSPLSAGRQDIRPLCGV